MYFMYFDKRFYDSIHTLRGWVVEGGFLQLNPAPESRSQRQVEPHAGNTRKWNLRQKREVSHMTRLYDLSFGRLHEFIRLLAEAGMTGEYVKTVLNRPGLAKTMVDALCDAMDDPGSGLLTPVSEYRDRIRARAHERNWPLYEHHLDALEILKGIDHRSTLKPVSVEVWLGRLGFTYEELWFWVVDELVKLNPRYGAWPRDESDRSVNLRFLPGAETEGDSRVTPIGLDFESCWNRSCGVRPSEARNPETAAGLELFTLLALNPQIIPRLGVDLPSFWVPRIQLDIPGCKAWSHVPIVGWDSAYYLVDLRDRREDNNNRFITMPVRRNLLASQAES